MFGKSIHREIRTTEIENARPTEEFNMLMIVVEDVLHGEDVYLEALDRHSEATVTPFKFASIAVSLALVAAYVLVILCVVRSEVAAPIRELTDALQKPKGLDEI